MKPHGYRICRNFKCSEYDKQVELPEEKMDGFEVLMKVFEWKWPKLEVDKDISLQRLRDLAKELKDTVAPNQ